MLKKVTDEFRRRRDRRRAGRAMRDQRHHRPDDGRDRRGRGRVAVEPRRQEGRAGEEEGRRRRRRAFRRRNWRRWSTRCRAAPTGCSNINMTVIACCSPPAAARRPHGRAMARTGATSFAALVKAASALPAGCLIDGEAVALGKNGKPDFGLLQATLKGGDADLAFYAFDLLVDQGEDITRAAQYRAQAAARGVAQGGAGADHLRRPCHRQGRGAVRRDLQGRRRGDHRQESRARPIAARAPRTGSRSNASSARSSSSSAGRRATRGAASARSTSRCAKEGKLTYAGKVGTGFNAALIESLSETMAPLGDRQAGARRAAHGAARIALDQAQTGRRSRLHRIHQRRRAPPPELHRAARGQEGQPGRARSARETAAKAQKKGERATAASLGARSPIPTASFSPATS